MIMGLAKIVQHGPAKTFRRITILYHLLELPVIIPLAILILRVLFDQKFLRHNVLRTEKQNALARLAVPPGTTCLLHISLHIFRHIKMDDISNVRLIDPHSKSVRRHHHANVIIEKRFLVLLALTV
ncbi:hypothetical protein D3C73_1425140 [compost metagenome]